MGFPTCCTSLFFVPYSGREPAACVPRVLRSINPSLVKVVRGGGKTWCGARGVTNLYLAVVVVDAVRPKTTKTPALAGA